VNSGLKKRRTPSPAANLASTLCLACGLCCDGTLFRDVELQPGDAWEKFRAEGLPLRASRRSVVSTENVSRFRVAAKPASEVNSPCPDVRDSTPQRIRLPQPCAALCSDLRCRVYTDRPSRCRAFECALFQAVARGGVRTEAALRVIRKTRQRAGAVRVLLRALDNSDEQAPLSARFQRVKRRVEAGPVEAASAHFYAKLTLAFHELNMVLRHEFYPDPAD